MGKSFIDRLLLPAVISLTTVIFALLILQQLLTQQQAQAESSTKSQALLVKDKLESELKARILPLELLRERWGASSELDSANMESDAGLAMSGYAGYQAIEWVDPTFHVLWAVPHGGNEVLSGADDLGTVQRTREALQAARDTGGVIATRSVDLQKGGRGLVVCVPLIRGGKLSGFLLGVFRDQDLFDSILKDASPGYLVAIFDGDQQIYQSGDAAVPRGDTPGQEENIDFQQLSWRAQVWPAPGKWTSAQSILPQITFVGGLVLAVWLAVTAYMAQTSRLQAKEVAAANDELKKEIAGREHAENALRDAQKMEAVGRLAGGIAHDFNNMLMVIRSHAELSLNYLSPDSRMRPELNEIVRTSDRASSLTRQLLAFGRKQVLQPKVLNLNTLVAQVTLLLPAVLGVDIELSLDLNPELGHVRADFSQIEQVVMNLVFNARDAMAGGGKLTIRTENIRLGEEWAAVHPEVQPGSYVVLSVQDTGCGMDREIQSHMFEPFFTTKDRTRGTGLGLASVYGTVHQSGGCITVSSKLGQGTTVQIYLPRTEDAIEVSETPQVRPQSLEGVETILVVEDDDAVRRMTREILLSKGYKVIEARNGADAINYLTDHKDSVDLVLTDVTMPGMKGQELGELVANLHSGVQVLYMSAYTEDAILNDGILCPGTAFIEKPFSADELARKVREVLGANRSNFGAQYASGS